MSDDPDYVLKNRAHWDKWAHTWVAPGEDDWVGEPAWGIWRIPEADLRLLPGDMTGMDAVELGCGTAYVCAWMARRGANVVGIDNSHEQLETARRLAAQHGIEIELIVGNAESVPKPDAAFDFAISEYGAAIYADPHKWIPEAHRLLRDGGELVIVGNHPFVMCVQDFNAGEGASGTLLEPYFGMHRIDWDDGEDQATEFNLPISGWFRLFDEVGFDIVRFHELQAPQPGAQMRYFVSADWAHAYPAELAWKLRKR